MSEVPLYLLLAVGDGPCLRFLGGPGKISNVDSYRNRESSFRALDGSLWHTSTTVGSDIANCSVEVGLPQTCLQGGSACTGAAVRRKLSSPLS